jgi:allene oxide cyclase-like protein
MPRKSSIFAVVVTLAIMTGGVTLASATSGDDGSRIVRLRERTTDFAFVENAPPGLLGDYLVLHADLFNKHGDKVGSDGGTCVFTSAAGESHCVVTLSFARGDITTQGLNTDPTIPFVALSAVTGGTGAFRGISGELKVRQLTEEEAILTLRLSRPVSLND